MSPLGPENFKKLKFKEMTPLLDFYNLMAYDYAGSWSKVSGHQANIKPSESKPETTEFSTTAALEYYMKTGEIPSDKITLGMPLYGRAFASTDGLGKAFDGVGEGSWEKGVWDYKALPQEGAKEEFDSISKGGAGASWSYDKKKRLLISYDTVAMSEEKTKFILDQKLGGAMWWESSGDRDGKNADKSKGSLIGTFNDGVTNANKKLENSENAIEFPESQYDNLKAGFPDK